MSPEQRTTSEASSNTHVEPGSPFDKSAPPDNDESRPQSEPRRDTQVHFKNTFENGKEKDGSPKREILQMEGCYEQLGFHFSEWKKWTILTIIFLVQVSMNFNTSLYSNGLEGISSTFGVSEQGARCGVS